MKTHLKVCDTLTRMPTAPKKSAAAPKPSGKKATQKPTKKPKDLEVQVEEPEVEETIVEETVEIDDTVSAPKKRKGHTRESVLELFDELLSIAESEISSLRSGEKPKGLGVKFLRGIVKRMKLTKTAASKVMKTRNVPKRESNKTSGFLKPVKLSDDMAAFTGWNREDLRSRVDVTKYLCQYITQHNLQNPDDRRIIRPDASLAALLDWDNKSNTDLTYYRMQTQMKRHFSNPT